MLSFVEEGKKKCDLIFRVKTPNRRERCPITRPTFLSRGTNVKHENVKHENVKHVSSFLVFATKLQLLDCRCS